MVGVFCRLGAAAFALVFCAATLAAGAGEPRVVSRIAVGGVRAQPCSVTAARGLLWVANFGDGTVQRVNPKTNRRVGKPIVVGSRPCPIVTGAGSVWTASYGGDRVDRIDPRRARVTRRIRVGRQPFDLIFAAGAAWVTNNADGTVSRIDPRRNRVAATIRVGGAPAGLSFAAGSVWVANGAQVQRIDPATNAVTTLPETFGGAAWFAADERAVWVAEVALEHRGAHRSGLRAWSSRACRRASAPSTGRSVPDGLVWIPNLLGNDVTVIDPATNAVVRTVPVGPGPFVLSVAFGDVWSPAYNGRHVWRLRVS